MKGPAVYGPDDERRVEFLDDLDVLPDTTSDEGALGWGDEVSDDSTSRLIAERPPHWD